MKYSMQQDRNELLSAAQPRRRRAGARLCLLAAALLAVPALQAEEPKPGGNQPQRKLPLIIGGEDVPSGTYPWLVAVERVADLGGEDGNFQAQFCSGTVIAPHWVLTAGHCMLRPGSSSAFREAAELNVLVGSTDLITDPGELIDVEQIIVHEGFNFTSMVVENDIALLKLATPVGVDPVTLNSMAENEAPGTESLTAGWGVTDEDLRIFPSRLQQVDVPLVSNQDCAAAYQQAIPAAAILDQHICAGFLGEGGKDSCEGDSGGPLFLVDDQNPPVQLGITSFGVGCASAEFPGVYTRVSSFLNWIEQNMVNTLIFSQIGRGEGLSADVVVFNQSPDQPASGEVLFWDEDGTPIDPALFLNGPVTPSGMGGTAPNAFNLAPLGTTTFSAGALGDLLIGSATVISDNPVSGVVRFSLNSGIAGIRSSQPGSSLITPVRFQGGVRTGLAVRNTEPAGITVLLALRNASGELLESTEQDLGVNARLARFADEIFPDQVVEGFVGTLSITCQECQVAVIALELGSNPGEFTALPVSRIQ